MKPLLAVLFLLCASLAIGAERAEFVGYLSDPAGRLFILYDGSTRESSVWMKLGQSWHGLTPTAFDPMEELLTVRDGAAESRLRLRDSKVADLRPVGASPKPAIDADTVTYGPEAKLRLRNATIWAPTGIMVSNRDQTIVGGDLVIERPNGMTFKVANGAMRINGDTMVLTGDSVVGYQGPVPSLPAAHP